MFPEPFTEKTAIDDLEPIYNDSDYRAVSIKMLSVMSLALSYITESDNPLIASYGVCFALGLSSVLETANMQDIARRIGCNDATISYHARRFLMISGLPESPLMRKTV
jgi:hypothetical protein